uniref:class I SAM-dependent methyltransferase n=1 Tax=uncultured Methanobrevibacter sp. TaxID=253161 RepID=UPI0025E34B88
MHRHWKNTILPIIKKIKPTHIVEVGSDTGINTKNILEYCDKNNAKLSAIDPSPNFNVEKFKNKYGNKFDFYKDLSLNILPFLETFEVILIDGDHNWYTIYNELKTIEKLYKKNNYYPIIFLHDTSWPYHRRDLYYNPKTIPEEYLLPYKNLGIIPNEKKLSKNKGMNASLNNAIFEGGNKNGVLTGIEDYINESQLDLLFYKIPAYNGLGILFFNDEKIKKIIENEIDYESILEDLEKYYLNLILSDIKDEKNKLIYDLTNEKNNLNNENLEKENTITQLTNKTNELNEINAEKENTITQLTNKTN